MNYLIAFSARSERDPDSLVGWMAEVAPHALGPWYTRLMAAIKSLDRLPLHCSRIPETDTLGLEVRELIFGRKHGALRIIFRLESQTVEILRIVNASRGPLRVKDLI